ncbi:hypothetical protein EPN83_00680 [Patescibacteria group bacterium]|nr:MAG: hypothetical protein EPN83_00680 [Patescibacteria group bacterium]
MYDPERVTYVGETDARNKRVKFGIKAKDRTRHVYVIGKTGMGKSTLLENMAVQDIQNGEGLAFVDPHGKTAEFLLDYVPEHRLRDVIYFAPFDTDYPISFNVMEDVGADKRHLVSSGLLSAFKKIWVDAWSARMEYILSNTILALLEYPDSTLISINRMLADKGYRSKVVAHITDPAVRAFWVDEFAKYTDRYTQEATPAIQNKVGQFISNPLVRNIIGQPRSTFDFRKVMDEGKVFIINLSKGRVGETNANLLGSMLITKIYLAALSRADASESLLAGLPSFNLFVDEFQSFANESFADILSEARKYKLNLTIAHQYIEQMSEEVRAAVFGNVGTMVTFRVGAYDAEVLEKEFAPTFTAEDLVNLGFAQIYLKLMIDGVSSSPFSATTLPPMDKPPASLKEQIIDHSRVNFARPRALVEAEILKWHEEEHLTPELNKRKEPRRTDFTDFKREKRKVFEDLMSAERVQEEGQKEKKGGERAPIPLGALRQPKKKKEPSPEHLSELRVALAAITNQQPPTNKQQQAEVRDQEIKNVSETADSQKEDSSAAASGTRPRPHGVSEEELKKLLHVDPVIENDASPEARE